jgi:uncharacterized short protein YbdD (DUF466 family)
MKKNLIEAVQRILGSSSYARYREHLKNKGGEEKPLTPQEFYLESLKRRYAGVSRCC